MVTRSELLIFVIGSGLRSLGSKSSPTGKRFVGDARTAPRYRLLSVADGRWAALIADERRGTSVEGELHLITQERWRTTLAAEPHGIAPATVELDDGRLATASFGDEPLLLARGAEDITRYGGFAAYIRARRSRGG
jgi:hypothetical protein